MTSFKLTIEWEDQEGESQNASVAVKVRDLGETDIALMYLRLGLREIYRHVMHELGLPPDQIIDRLDTELIDKPTAKKEPCILPTTRTYLADEEE